MSVVPVVGVPVVVEVLFQAADATADVVADGGVDDVAAGAVQQVEQVAQKLGDRFIFAGLAGHDEQDFVATGTGYAVHNGAGGVELVGVERGLQNVAREGFDVEQDVAGGGHQFRSHAHG